MRFRIPVPAIVSRLGRGVQSVLKGEALRAINYGAVAVVYVTVKVLVATGNLQDPPDFDGIAVLVGAAVAAVTELARRFVFSENTVEVILDTAYDAGVELEPKPGIGDTT